MDTTLSRYESQEILLMVRCAIEARKLDASTTLAECVDAEIRAYDDAIEALAWQLQYQDLTASQRQALSARQLLAINAVARLRRFRGMFKKLEGVMGKRYVIEIREAPTQGGWQWEVWAATELTMVAQGWTKTKAAARRIARACRNMYESEVKQ